MKEMILKFYTVNEKPPPKDHWVYVIINNLINVALLDEYNNSWLTRIGNWGVCTVSKNHLWAKIPKKLKSITYGLKTRRLE